MKKNPVHSYNSEGKYTILLTVIDYESLNSSDTTIAYIDETPPAIEITKPIENYLYIFGFEITLLPFKTRVLGDIDISVEIDDEISDTFNVTFYLDDNIVEIDNNWPYYWRWDEPYYFKHTIIIEAADICENIASKTLEIWKLF